MLRTFRVNDVCKFPNAELYEQAIEYARSKGVPVYRGCKKGSFNAFPFLGLDGTIEMSGFLSTNKSPNITIPEFFQNCDNWKECGSKPSEGEYIRYGAKVKVRDKNDEDWKIGYRYLVCRSQGQYRHLVLRDGDFNTFHFCELDETPEQTERQKQIAELETKMEEMKATIKKLKDADAN
jgi:hypothetical protein